MSCVYKYNCTLFDKKEEVKNKVTILLDQAISKSYFLLQGLIQLYIYSYLKFVLQAIGIRYFFYFSIIYYYFFAIQND